MEKQQERNGSSWFFVAIALVCAAGWWISAASNSKPAAVTSPAGPAAIEPDPVRGITVYRTRTGSKYHRATCSSLRSSSFPLSLAEAQDAGLGPCSRCKP